MTEVLEEAWELVEEHGLSDEDFHAFSFGNAVRLWASLNPDFFKGTVVEKAARELIDREAGPIIPRRHLNQMPQVIHFVPTASAEMLRKALLLKADALVLDLEDSVTPDNKNSARATSPNGSRCGLRGHASGSSASTPSIRVGQHRRRCHDGGAS